MPGSRRHVARPSATMMPVKRALVLPGIVVLACLTRSAGASGVENAPTRGLPALPGAPRASSADASRQNTGPLASPTPQPVDDRMRRGIVLVEQHGDPIAIGTILGRDGRVLTALSGLAGAAAVDLRYADGSMTLAWVGRSDKASDLALLVPRSPAWTEGLDASDIDPDGAELRAMLPSRGGRLGATPAEVHGDVAAHGEKGQPTVRMLDVSVKAPTMAGAPLLDAGGRVVAVLVHACKVVPTFPPASTMGGGEQLPLPPPPCVPETLGAPVAAIRSFLAGPVSPPAPWLGIRGEPEEHGRPRGVRVVATESSSPAERAGLRPSTDLIVAVDGQPVDTPARLAELIGRHTVGDTVKLLVFSDSGFRNVPVYLSRDRHGNETPTSDPQR
jgi:S1-C subfamily serine protease